MSVQNSNRSYIGIAKEVTKGTPVAPTDFIPVALGSLKPADIVDPLYDEGIRGSLVSKYNYVPGRTRSTLDYGGAVFADTVGYALAGILGDVVTVGASAPFTHTMSLKNSAVAAADAQPISYTITDFYSAAVRAYPGCQFSDFSLKFNADGMLEYDAKTTGWISATASTPTPTFSTVLPTQVWQGSVSVAGSTVTNSISGNIDMKRGVTPVYGIATTQNPYSVFLGELEVTGKITFLMETDAQLTNFLTNTQPALVFNWAYGAGATAIQLQATLTKGAYVAAAIERGDDMVKITVDINGQGNTTDAGATLGYSPIKWVLKNAKAASTYV
jgi:Phage tail tube protein